MNIELQKLNERLLKGTNESNNLMIANDKYLKELEYLKNSEEENQLKENDIISELNLKISELKDNLAESNNSNEHLVIEVIYLLLYFLK